MEKLKKTTTAEKTKERKESITCNTYSVVFYQSHGLSDITLIVIHAVEE